VVKKLKKVDLGSLAIFFSSDEQKKNIFTVEFSHFFDQQFWKKYFFYIFFSQITKNIFFLTAEFSHFFDQQF
jgi:hypothetical protein